MTVLVSLYSAVTLYGLILFFTGFATLKPEVRKNLNPTEIEQFDLEMEQRQIVGLLLLFVPILTLMIWLIFYF